MPLAARSLQSPMDLTTLKDWLAAGPAAVYLIATILIARQYLALQTRYESMLERCIQALTRVADHLDKDM